MIAYLSGTVLKKYMNSLILHTAQGVGYKVSTPQTVLETVHESQVLHLFIYSHIREDTFALYGFSNENELQFFEQIISINGIGPKMGMDILSQPVHLMKQAILQNDVPFLTRIKGLGKKTAERMVLELKNKIVEYRV